MSIKESTVLETIYEIERNLPVENLVEYGVYLWPLIRIQLALEIFYSASTAISPQKGILNRIHNAFIRPVLNQWRVQLLDFKHNDKLRRAEILFLSDSVNRRIETPSGEHIDIFTELIGRKLLSDNLSTWLSLERTPQKYPRWEKSKPIATSLVWQKIECRFKGHESLSVESQEILSKIESKMYSAGFKVSCLSSNLTKALNHLLIAKKSYLRTLDIVKPKLVIQSNWYSLNSMAMKLACCEKNIPFVDYQHGTQGPAHVAYGKWTKPFSNGISLFPDIFLCWTKQDVENIKSWLPREKGEAFCVGNILFNEIKAGRLPFLTHRDKTSLKKVDGVSNILLTLQPNYFLNDAILKQIAAFQENTFWWIRLHPSMRNEFQIYKSQLESKFINLRFNIEEATLLPLPYVLSQVDLHITFNSTVVMEAAMMEVQSIILDSDLGFDSFEQYINSGIALLGNQNIIPRQKIKVDDNMYSDIAKILKKFTLPQESSR